MPHVWHALVVCFGSLFDMWLTVKNCWWSPDFCPLRMRLSVFFATPSKYTKSLVFEMAVIYVIALHRFSSVKYSALRTGYLQHDWDCLFHVCVWQKTCWWSSDYSVSWLKNVITCFVLSTWRTSHELKYELIRAFRSILHECQSSRTTHKIKYYTYWHLSDPGLIHIRIHLGGGRVQLQCCRTWWHQAVSIFTLKLMYELKGWEIGTHPHFHIRHVVGACWIFYNKQRNPGKNTWDHPATVGVYSEIRHKRTDL